ncbi:MAG: carbohydrate-binding protein, partial [Bacteroidales bacterium]|nr:carbohydrate-binding protein [Bacteroidales bacterium]
PDFIPHQIPGTINATDFDYGGEGIAYHDAETDNQGSGPRQNEWVDTENSDNNKPNVGWIISGEWLEYSIRVDETNTYKVNVRIASNSNAARGPLKFIVNGEERASLTTPNTGGWNVFKTYSTTLQLSEEDTLLRLDMGNGNFNVGNLVFSITNITSDIHDMNSTKINVYPVPFRNELILTTEEQIQKIEIIDITGRIVLTSVPVTSGVVLNTASVKEGTYVLKTTMKDGTVVFRKIYK